MKSERFNAKMLRIFRRESVGLREKSKGDIKVDELGL
jgi:hypothetical protein